MVRRSQSPSLIQLRARQHRTALTHSEQLLWARINAGQLGVYFRRQVVIGSFIVDFLAPAARLVVEVDGGYHVTRRNADRRRDRALSALGYRVLRLTEHSVRTNLESSVEQIGQALIA